LLKQTTSVVGQVEQANQLVEKEIEAVADVVTAFERVEMNADQTDGGIQEISESTDSQASSAEEVVSMVDEVADISDESADEAESVSAVVEEQTASLNEISKNMQGVSATTQELKQLVGAFSVDGVNPKADTGAPIATTDD